MYEQDRTSVVVTEIADDADPTAHAEGLDLLVVLILCRRKRYGVEQGHVTARRRRSCWAEFRDGGFCGGGDYACLKVGRYGEGEGYDGGALAAEEQLRYVSE